MTDTDHSAEGDKPSRVARAARTSVLLTATIEQFGTACVLTHKVRDLSCGGVRVDQGEMLRRGATVVITVGMLEALPATVVWIAGGWAGLRFAHEIEPDQARARAVVKPKLQASTNKAQPSRPAPPTAGWAGEMQNAYHR